MSLKANHPTLIAQVKAWFETAQSTDFAGIEYSYDQRVEAGHHRQENRLSLGSSAYFYPRPLSTVALGRATKHRDGRQSPASLELFRTREVQFYLSSLPCNAVEIGRAIRAHWGIENKLHWVLDVTNGYGCFSYPY